MDFVAKDATKLKTAKLCENFEDGGLLLIFLKIHSFVINYVLFKRLLVMLFFIFEFLIS